MTERLTSEELSWLDTIFTQVEEELRVSVSDIGSVPLSYLASSPMSGSALESHRERNRRVLIRRASQEDFIALEALGKCKLSKETRRAELKRLKRKYKKRKKYKLKYGKKHHKQKEVTKREYNNRRWEKQPLERFKYTSRKPVRITQEEWDKYIQPVWQQYDRKYIKFRGGDAKGYTAFNLILEYHPPKERYARKKPTPVIVYDGYDQAVYAAMGK